MKKVYADSTLGYVDTTHFDIPKHYIEQFKCTEQAGASNNHSFDDIFGDF
jgi:hypothetical protein